jgi:hypothetical protein
MAQAVGYLPETSAIGYEAARSCFPYDSAKHVDALLVPTLQQLRGSALGC